MPPPDDVGLVEPVVVCVALVGDVPPGGGVGRVPVVRKWTSALSESAPFEESTRTTTSSPGPSIAAGTSSVVAFVAAASGIHVAPSSRLSETQLVTLPAPGEVALHRARTLPGSSVAPAAGSLMRTVGG